MRRPVGEGRLLEVIRKAGTSNALLPGDEIPQEWLPEAGSDDDAAAGERAS